ncbi:pimeloyl-ACP methyl ester carboxylesterase [Mucilaginibacter oryzae]|uniref:Pimeloyl-ACP methyl ester carboxylesterase n=1 Tax=Mucilaginibacter oryzae TaxID=468058 RepID=A0A316HDM0_9SPHI|nr:alpha/beta hydrolase [Mucilaginibacter oryzae]PWK79319.1 pimeloyl-ACP methyl ester carboxylesterase [Mucilaginibacter oryzae]
MDRIYLIAGLGADTRVYNNISLTGDCELIRVDWVEPDLNDTLTAYAQRLIFQYNIKPGSVLIGNSLGGVIAVEMAKFMPVKKVILISSIKTSDEAPWYFKLFRTLPVYKLIPGKVFNLMAVFIKPVFGHMSAEDAWLFGDMLRKSSLVFIKWAMYAILHWKNSVVPPNLYHITGDKDLVFDYKRIKGATIVKGGTHIMIFDKAEEINKILKGILENEAS